MSLQPINPRPFLNSLVGSNVIVKIKFNDLEYHGKLISVDNYMNVLLQDVEECTVVNGKTTSQSLTGEVLVRCNNVGWISKI
ncbi:mRNA splicing protein [Martiniozyma asiatica (nom. inval.)]|nr:mRNA splicing protein [Martiniozyma asiatica]